MARPRKAASAKAKSLEQTLWDAADKMRGNLEAGEYKHVVLGLVFLKFISDAFESRRAFLEAATADETSEYFINNPLRRPEIVESRDEYTALNVFWVPAEARWGFLQDRAKQPEIGVLLDAAMDLIEAENPDLGGQFGCYLLQRFGLTTQPGEPGMDLLHEAVEVDALFVAELQPVVEEIDEPGLAAADAAPDVESR